MEDFDWVQERANQDFNRRMAEYDEAERAERALLEAFAAANGMDPNAEETEAAFAAQDTRPVWA